MLFIPLAALLLQAFARPEIKRELEQISTLKSTEIFQEKSDWTERKFLDELRKCLPEGASNDLNLVKTSEEVINVYQFGQNGKINTMVGLYIPMNRHARMLVNNTYVEMKDIPELMEKNLFGKVKEAPPVIIDGKEANRIIRYTAIQKDVSTPEDAYQQLLNTVGEAYMLKRNEVAGQYYQTRYEALNADKKAKIDQVVPMIVLFLEPKNMTPTSKTEVSKKEKENQKVVYSDSSIQEFITYGEFAGERRAKYEKINNRQVTYNDRIVLVKDLFELLNKDTNKKVRMVYAYHVTEGDCQVRIITPSIDPKNPEYYYVMNGKWVYQLSIDVDLVNNIDVYPPEIHLLFHNMRNSYLP